MKKLITCMVFVFALTACAGVNVKITRPDYCVGKESLFYSVLEPAKIDPKTVSGLLLSANYLALETGLYDAKTALLGLSVLETLLEKDVTYYTFMQAFMEHFGCLGGTRAAAFVVFLIPYLPAFETPNLISDCDCALISLHIQDQRAMIMKLVGGV